jgi:hypothetical protein
MFHIDRHIAVSAGWFAGPAFGLAMMVAPEYLHPSHVLAGCLFWGGLGLFSLTLLIVLILSIREQDRRATKLGPLVVIAIGLAIFGAGVAWYFWPSAALEATASPAPTPPAAEPQLPQNAKFSYHERVYWVTPRQYTKEEAADMRAALREIYDSINTKSAPLVSTWDGPAVMFTRNWLSLIQTEGPQSAISKLNNMRNHFISAYQELQAILERRPYYRQDLRTIVDDRGEMGEVNGALNRYIDALRALPEKPTPIW